MDEISPKISKEVIPGTSGYYRSDIELIIYCDNKLTEEKVKNRLTITNKAVQGQIRHLKQVVPKTPQHAWYIAKKLKELLPQEHIQCFSTRTDMSGTESFSVPPGFWFIVQKLTQPPIAYHNQLEPKWLGYERYYQKDIVSTFMKYKRASAQACTGSGKGLCIRVLCRSFASIGWRTIVIVPSVELLNQTFYPLREDMSFTSSCLGGGHKAQPGCQVLVSTAQSALQEIDKYDVVIFDEGHRCSADTWQRLCVQAVDAKRMYALTATPERPDGLSDLIWAWCGPIMYEYPARQAILDGYLSIVEYKTRLVNVPIPQERAPHPAKEYDAYHGHPNYLRVVKMFIDRARAKGRKILVLFKSIECCERLARLMEDGTQAAHGNYRVPFIKFKAGETDLCIATVSLLGEGIDVPDISALIYCCGSTSPVSVMQAFGRATRIAPGKKDAIIVDVSPSTGKWIAKMEERKKLAEQYSIEPEELERLKAKLNDLS